MEPRSSIVLGETFAVLLGLGCITLRRRLLEVILAILSDNQTPIAALLEPVVLVLDVHVRQHELPDLINVVVNDTCALDFCVALRFGHLCKDVQDSIVKLHHDQLLVCFGELA